MPNQPTASTPWIPLNTLEQTDFSNNEQTQVFTEVNARLVESGSMAGNYTLQFPKVSTNEWGGAPHIGGTPTRPHVTVLEFADDKNSGEPICRATQVPVTYSPGRLVNDLSEEFAISPYVSADTFRSLAYANVVRISRLGVKAYVDPRAVRPVSNTPLTTASLLTEKGAQKVEELLKAHGLQASSEWDHGTAQDNTPITPQVSSQGR